VSPGECIALVGASGAGKSTLLSVLYEHAQSSVAYMPQELGLVQSLSVFHNVYMGRLEAHSSWYNLMNLIKPKKKDIQDIYAILQQIGMEDKIWMPVKSLSGGQKQRTAVARSLNQAASMLLADEPVSALDGPMADIVMQRLTERFSTSVIALHDVGLALKYADRIIGISEGRIQIDAPSPSLGASDLAALYVSES
jgi:phosphonate transport system ATP-binding protein